MVGLIIGAAAFGASTAGAGGDLQGPGRTAAHPAEIEEECAEGCDQEEINEYVWGEGLPRVHHRTGLRGPPRPPSGVAADTP